MGNEEAQELIHITHGHELRWGNDGGKRGTGWRGIKGRKKWDNCNSIIKKYILKNRDISDSKNKKKKVFTK